MRHIFVKHALLMIFSFILSGASGRGCDVGLHPTIYDDSDCKDKNTAQTNLIGSGINLEFIQEMNKCDNVEVNGRYVDVIINCNKQSLNFTRYESSNKTCSGMIMEDQPYVWGECYPSLFGHNQYMTVKLAKAPQFIAYSTAILTLLAHLSL